MSTPLVSWNWGGGAPGGTVAEIKDEGEIAIKSKRGNTIKKNASPDNPAVRVERSGNNVVKRASELTVDKKASENKNKEGDGSSKRKAESQEDSDNEANKDGNGAREASDPEYRHTITKQGKEVKEGGRMKQRNREMDIERPMVKERRGEEEDKKEEHQNGKPKHTKMNKKTENMKKIEVDLNMNKGRPSSKSKTGAKKGGTTSHTDEDVVSTRTRSHAKGV
ncbi:hypothetical protein CIB48_g4267 [Xylaria polymorpha]|nr:hypothetical protein CIB48_g4267 [Xylaria polymorpha]